MVAFSIFSNVLMLTGPLFMLQIYDRVIASSSVPTLVGLTVLAAAALLTMAGLEIMRSAVLQRLAVRFEASCGPEVFEAAVWSRISGRAAGGQYLSDLETLRHFINGQGVIAILDAPWAPFYLVVIFQFHPMLGAVASVGAALLFGLAWINEVATADPQRRGAVALADTQRFSDASLQCSHAARAMGMISSLCRRWADEKLTALGFVLCAGERSAVAQAVSRCVRHGLQIAMLAAGALLVIDKSITAGVMVVASIIMGRALSPVEQAIGHWRSLQAARMAWKRLTDVLQAAPPKRATVALPKPKGAISVEQLFSVPPGARMPALKSISFEVRAGEQLAIIGHSGAGKSSLAKILVGVWQPASGTVRFDGAALHDYDPEVLGRQVGYLPQEVDLLEGTIADNIARFSNPRDDAEIVRAARQADAHDLILRMPDGYETRMTDFGRSLSGGERQRVALARALYGRPSVVVLDEPAANLDRDGELALMRALSSAREAGTTTVLVAHRPSLIEQADRVLVLDEGRIAAFGTRDEVFARLFPRGVVHSLQGRDPEPQALRSQV